MVYIWLVPWIQAVVVCTSHAALANHQLPAGRAAVQAKAVTAVVAAADVGKAAERTRPSDSRGKRSPNDLWEVVGIEERWDPARRPKSLAFLGRVEGEQNLVHIDSNAVDPEQEEEDEEKKPPMLNVSDKDSPYALIDKYFPERESYFYQNKDNFYTEYNKGNKPDIGNLQPEEVWLADSSLLVLKGGGTVDRNGFDDVWEPLDDYEAPYREPVLPPPDFDPDTLDLGVGVPIEEILRQRTASPITTLPTTELSVAPTWMEWPETPTKAPPPRSPMEASKAPPFSSPARATKDNPFRSPVEATKAPPFSSPVRATKSPPFRSPVEAPKAPPFRSPVEATTIRPELGTINNKIDKILEPYEEDVSKSDEKNYQIFIEEVNQFIAQMESFDAEKKVSEDLKEIKKKIDFHSDPDFIEEDRENFDQYADIEDFQPQRIRSEFDRAEVSTLPPPRSNRPKGHHATTSRPTRQPEEWIPRELSARLQSPGPPLTTTTFPRHTSENSLFYTSTLAPVPSVEFAKSFQLQDDLTEDWVPTRIENYPPHRPQSTTPVPKLRFEDPSPVYPTPRRPEDVKEFDVRVEQRHQLPAGHAGQPGEQGHQLPVGRVGQPGVDSAGYSVDIGLVNRFEANKDLGLRLEPVDGDTVIHARQRDERLYHQLNSGSRSNPGFKNSQEESTGPRNVDSIGFKNNQQKSTVNKHPEVDSIGFRNNHDDSSGSRNNNLNSRKKLNVPEFKANDLKSDRTRNSQQNGTSSINSPNNKLGSNDPMNNSAGDNQSNNQQIDSIGFVNEEAESIEQNQNWNTKEPVPTPRPTYSGFVPVTKPVPGTPVPAQSSSLPPPLSVFQTVPENIDESAVFDLSRNVQFGTRIPFQEQEQSRGRPRNVPPAQQRGKFAFPNPAHNEVDTGTPSRNSLQQTAPISRTPRRKSFQPVNSHPRRPPSKPLVRNAVRRRKPVFRGGKERTRKSKHLAPPPIDRNGSGDVRYVSFFSGGRGGRSWGYSYHLG